jgi:hypothetical protein
LRICPTFPSGAFDTLATRPDVAAAERRVAAANANIGVAKAAFYPDISLGLDGGYQSDTFSPWLMAPNEIWSVGPQLLVHDLRWRQAQRSRGEFAGANSPRTARSTGRRCCVAFQQVEDNLALLHHLGDESDNEDQALSAAQQTLALATSQYRDGVVSYLDVVTAQTTELTAQISSLDLRTRQLTASVSLIRGARWWMDREARLTLISAAEVKTPPGCISWPRRRIYILPCKGRIRSAYERPLRPPPACRSTTRPGCRSTHCPVHSRPLRRSHAGRRLQGRRQYGGSARSPLAA